MPPALSSRRRPALVSWLALSLSGLLGACQQAPEPSLTGYVEGDYRYLAAPVAGYLQSTAVARGAQVSQGATLFALQPDPDDAGVDELQARTAAAQARALNLQATRRPPEIAQAEATLQAALAAERLAQLQWKQQQALADQGFISGARLNEARHALDQAQSQVQGAREQVAVARLSLGRQAEQRAAQADVQAAQAQLVQRRWALEHRQVRAPASGLVSELYYRPGEWVPAGAPVVALLPDDARRLRFFVPQALLAGLHLGDRVQARCDGCPQPVNARIDHIAAQAEYTPPQIYSRDQRARLVFRVEAVPELPEQARRLPPGLPLDIALTAASSSTRP